MAFVGERNGGIAQVVTGEFESNEVLVVGDVDGLQVVVLEQHILQRGVFGDINFTQVVVRCGEIDQVGVVSDVEFVEFDIIVHGT